MRKLLVIGGGPAGLSAAINAASEGLAVTILDKADALGGQFHESFDIENYPGVPKVTGRALSSAMIKQAAQFNVAFHAPVGAANITREENSLVVTSEDYDEYRADAVVLALGLQYRRLDAAGVSKYMGRGVYCGPAPYVGPECLGAVIVGGGNSAGQEALRLAQLSDRKVTLVIRSQITDKMSAYLIDLVRTYPNVEVVEGAEIGEVRGKDWLEEIELKDGRIIPATVLVLYIGAVPHTYWLRDLVTLDDHKFIVTSRNSYDYMALAANNAVGAYLPGVFAIGDARAGSVKRIGAAVGEGCIVVPSIHKYLATLEN